MSMQKHLEELIRMADLFIDLELSLEKYYDFCAKIFPDEKYAWFGISTQESIHAKIFKKMKELMTNNPEKWSLGKYNYEALKTTVDLLHARIKKNEANDYDSRVVVSFAKDIESSLVESDIVNAFVSDCSEYQVMVRKIAEETDEHKDFMNRFLSSRNS
ncbi:MAG TPA: hypothetical protein PKK26_06000 [Candidatus Wallbacteria bacterium]|nr:hypothetical protein [Candidatus Wallbacteria bacterium]